ncbi:phosphate/phosphite/phosphonate ABC transporter substrate-binding protein [Natronorubrum sp. FCH18a]|uniref:phosphate/phosphite/phosphonate ABC transporter substrate-binding protein n=1 Tax=Natronorubrum sp. FCH18a TaxID=3447018 RepID=UPI003F514D8C
MADNQRHSLGAQSRRRYLLTGSAVVGGLLAGCVSGDDSNGGDPDSYPDWDPDDPQFPQLASTLLADDFHIGTDELLEQMEPRDEPRYGSPPPETPDAGDRLDPDTLDFSMVPTEDPATYEDVLAPLVENIEAETGKDVVVNPLDSYAAQIEAMNADRLHVAGFATGATPFAVNIAGAVPFGIQIADGAFGYRLWVISQVGSDIDELADLDGADVTHVEESSNSGHQAPSALFSAGGVEPGEDYDLEFSGSHENSIRAVDAGDYDAAPIASTVLERQIESGHVDGDDLKVVWVSDPFPTTSFCYHHALEPELQEGIERAHLEYDYAGTALEEYYDRDSFTEIDYATHWDVILEIQEQNEADYRTDELED